MRRSPAILVAAVLIGLSSSATAHAQPTPLLHISSAHDSCFFELHSELTPAQFEDFARELGSILRFRPLGETTPLGKGRYDIGLQYTSSSIDDSKGAWNNTMSHPSADHYLGDAIMMPRIVARFGVADHIDIGVWGTVNPESNYGVVGFDTSIALLQESDGYPVFVVDQTQHLVAGRTERRVGWQREFRRRCESNHGCALAVRRRRNDGVHGDLTDGQGEPRSGDGDERGRVCRRRVPMARARAVGGSREGCALQLWVPNRHAFLGAAYAIRSLCASSTRLRSRRHDVKRVVHHVAVQRDRSQVFEAGRLVKVDRVSGFEDVDDLPV